MNDDALRSIYGVCPEVSDISGKCVLHFFGGGLFIVSRSEGRTVRSFHNLYHHMSSVIIDQVSFRIFSVRIRPFAIWIVFVLPVFERGDFPGADQLLLHSGSLSIENLLHTFFNPSHPSLDCLATSILRSEIEKHQGRRFPAASIEQAFSIRRLCASGCSAESIQLIKSLRSIGVRSLHWAFAFGLLLRAV